jgi:hypothetical protein
MVILLGCSDGELQLNVDETGWCDVALVTRGNRHQLGADTLKAVAAKLSNGLKDGLEGEASGTIDDVKVRWVLSLAERHCSVYAADVSGRRVLFFQGADGGLLDRLSLDQQERRVWWERLCEQEHR